MNWNDISILYRRELRSALRERSIVVNSVLIPILLYPLLLWLMYTGITFVSGQTSDMTSRIALMNFPSQHEQMRKDLVAGERLQIIESQDPQSALKAGLLDAIVEFQAVGDNNFRAHITYDESRAQSSQARTRVEQKI